MSRRRLIVLSLLAAPLLLVLIAGGLLFGATQTDFGREALRQQIETAVTQEGGLQLSLGKIEGSLFSSFQIARITLADPTGDWLIAENLTVSWSPSDLLNKRVTIGDVALQSLDVLREPRLPPSPDVGGADGIPSLPVDVSLNSLEISRIRLTEELAGQEAIFRLAMTLNAASEESVRSKLDLQQLEGGEASLTGLVEFHPVKETLGVDIALSEPENGLIARTLQIPGVPPVELSILGDGSIASWQGQILGTAGDQVSADFLVTTQASGLTENERFQLDLQGSTRVTGLLPKDMAPLAEPRLDIETTLSWSGKDQEIGIESATVQSSAFRLDAEGTFAVPDEAIAGKIKLVTADNAAITPLIAPAEFETAQIDVSFTGNLQKLSAELALQAEGLSVTPEVSFGKFAGDAQTTVSLEQLERLPLQGTARIEDINGLPTEASALLGERLNVDFDLLLDVPDQHAEARQIEATGAGFTLSGAGTAGLRSRKADAKFALLLNDLSLLGPVTGQLKLDADVATEDFEQSASLQLKAVTGDLDPGDAQLKQLIGEVVDLQAAIEATPEDLRISALELNTAFAKATATAHIPLSLENLQASFETHVPDLAALNDIAGVALAGTAGIAGQLEGTLEDPGLSGTTKLTGFSLDGIALGVLESEYAVSQLLSAPQGSLESRLINSEATVELATNFALADGDRLDISGLTLTHAENRIAGKVSVPLDGSPVSGAFDGQIPDLTSLARLAGQAASGAIEFSATLAANGARQDASITLDATGLRLDPSDSAAPSLANLKAQARARDLLGAPIFEATATGSNFQAGGFGLDALELKAGGTAEAVSFGFDINKSASPALEFSGNGQVELLPQSTTVMLASLNGSFEDMAIELLQPLLLRQNEQGMLLEGLKLNVDGGEINAAAELGATSADTNLSLTQLPLTLLALADPQLATDGVLDGQVRFGFAAGKASGKFQIAAVNVKPRGEDFVDLPALNGTLAGDLTDGRLTFSGDIAGLEDTAIKTKGSVPVDVALDPVVARIPENQPMDASLTLRGDLAALWPLLAIDEHLLAGKIAADVKVAGSISGPQLDGTATLTEGRYENLELGTLLTDLSFTAALSGPEKVVLSLSAKDSEDGTITAEGEIDLRDGTNPGIELTTNLAKARLLRRDDILAQAGGTINLSGTPSELSVNGDVTTDLVEINIGGALPPSIVDLPVEERNRPGETNPEAAEKTEESSSPPATVNLDLTLSMPRRVFIRGRGLESEWSGQFKIKGTADAPVIEGDLSPVRGDFTFAGKSFALQKGKVSLAGGKEIDPDLDLSAVYEADGLKAIVAITGTASSPEINLSSEPELPQDEILAQVLFGKSTGQLSPVEALQLAEAVASVSGKLGSGEGIIGLVRKTVGVDVLTAGTNQESGEVEVRAGKYVTDDVFVGVTQGADPTSTKVTVEVEVTPNISVESDVGQDASGRVGVFWKFDY
ncbi:translocation/assembly module TamB domain-containing protein [Pelagibius sp. Alg239-R121]|uniref:translocation/assembly module TamB domain-containing protein n=1 Tax=Pelagibius sp. Alg239-R121 TaxID=2993448 RepID=UPI0024A72351|nr:translocation/assembly module TamB domain-containing protein [Pelagibius sp. Alg239-R121]